MTSEINKLLCAILTAILLFLLASFISELLFPPDKQKGKVSYLLEEIIQEDREVVVNEQEEAKIINSDNISLLMKQADKEAGEKFIKKNCGVCHNFSLPHKNKIGPSLALLLDREIGLLEGYKYSKAFKSIEDSWNLINLYNFLENPKKWLPGTKMSYKGIKKENDLLNVLKYFASNTSNGN